MAQSSRSHRWPPKSPLGWNPVCSHRIWNSGEPISKRVWIGSNSIANKVWALSKSTCASGTLELQRKAVERAMQAKADAVGAQCPCCQRPLIEKKYRVPKTIDSYCGKLRLHRTHGWCKGCRQWVFPADAALGLCPDSTASLLVQEMSALLVTKMPAEQAEAVSGRITGRKLSRSTLAREAKRQGD